MSCLPSVQEVQNNVKTTWEDYNDVELERLSNQGWLKVTLRNQEERWVRTCWFSSLGDSPLCSILLDTRWGGVPGTLDCHPEVFDDVCAFLKNGCTLPPVHPRGRRRRLREAADFYCLRALEDLLDETEDGERAQRQKLANEKAAAVRAAADRRRRANRKSRVVSAPEDRARVMIDQYEQWSQKCNTKAQDIKSQLHGVQRAFRDGGGPTHGCNRQLKLNSSSIPKGQRHCF